MSLYHYYHLSTECNTTYQYLPIAKHNLNSISGISSAFLLSINKPPEVGSTVRNKQLIREDFPAPTYICIYVYSFIYIKIQKDIMYG